jgi:hypothetical protein
MSLLLSMMIAVAPVDTIYVSQYIRTVSPKVNQDSADRLASIITKWSRYYGLDPFLVSAIIRQESNFEPNQQVCIYSQYYKRTFCDHGISQINDIWIKPLNLSRAALVTDDHYNVSIMTKILAKVRDQYANDKEWYGNYHDSRPKYKSAWLKSVHQWYAMLYTTMQYTCYGYTNVYNPQIQDRPRRYYDEHGCIVATATQSDRVQADRRGAVLVLADTKGDPQIVQSYGID